jgi:hypothetical protein
MEWYLLIAVMPSLFKTDSQHFLLSLPLIIILLCFLSMKKNYLLIIGFVVLMCMYGANSSDLLGNILSAKLEASGILGISNLILIITTIYVYITFLRIQTSTAMSLQSEK